MKYQKEIKESILLTVAMKRIKYPGINLPKETKELYTENIRHFRCDLNQIPYDYTVEVRNRFKGLDLIDRLPGELWMEVHDIVQETGIKNIPMEKKCKKSKMSF